MSPEPVAALVADLFRLEPGDLDVHASFIDLGADSLLLARLSREVEDRFGRTVGVAELFDEVDDTDRLRTAVGPVSAPTVGAGPVAASHGRVAAPGDAVERIVAEQLALMARQLDLLSGTAPAPAGATPAPVVTPGLTAVTGTAGAAVVARTVAPRQLSTAQQAHLDELFATYSARTAA